MPAAQVADPEWNDTAVRLIRRTGATALPVYFCGHNGVGFQLLGMIHPKLRTAFLLQEFLNQEGKRVEVRVGSPVQPDALAALADDRKAIEYLRWRTYLLARRSKAETSWPIALRTKLAAKIHEPLASATPQEALAEEIANLRSARCLAENADLAVYLGTSSEIPQLLLEVGRLRELTFRRTGEGTGKSRDLDSFDDYYWHVLLWHKKSRNWSALIVPAAPGKSSPSTAPLDSIPALSFAMTNASSKSFTPSVVSLSVACFNETPAADSASSVARAAARFSSRLARGLP